MGSGIRHGRHRWVIGLKLFSQEQNNEDPFYVEIRRPRGYGWVACQFTGTPGDRTLCFSVEKRFSAGPLTRAEVAVLEAIRPQLGLAAVLAAESAFLRGAW